MKDFISQFSSTVIGTLDDANLPFSSYAPFIYDNHCFYIYISNIAKHAQNLQARADASLFFIEDESATENMFARKRVSLQCKSQKIERASERFEEVFSLYNQKFDASTVEMLKKMEDFNLFELKVHYGEATFGFGEAYNIGGDHMDKLVARQGGSGHGHGKTKG